jgi:hypothetical protein
MLLLTLTRIVLISVRRIRRLKRHRPRWSRRDDMAAGCRLAQL